MPLDLVALKTRQQSAWASGDYAVVGTTLQIVGETLCEAVDLRSGERVLDVAGGNGNAALAAARRFAHVTCTDYVPTLLAAAQARADAEHLPITTEVADAEALPYANASFDVVLSTFGVMFTPDQERAASELMRVCRPGGRIGLANWTPGSFVGQLFKTLGRFLPPPAGVSPPSAWGTDERLRTLFAGASHVAAVPRHFTFRYQSAAHWIEVFRTFYGPLHKAFGALDEARQAELTAALHELIRTMQRGRRAGPGG